MKGRTPTASEKRHMSLVADLGCIVCTLQGLGDSPAEIHHITAGQGISQRADAKHTLPLCPMHHRIGGNGVAIHAGRRTWEKKYGTELELLEMVRKQVQDES